MSQEIRNIIFEEPVLLSQAAQIGEFVGRYFYHIPLLVSVPSKHSVTLSLPPEGLFSALTSK
ncbi:MAG TPA: hypothetical protein VK712_02290 [Verrucomicrobiae bacterium]|jgi:hypothetical protein|nr:hypothetical protein [Verrucomicrobiae bacterium]